MLYKQFPNVKMYNKNGQVIDPFSKSSSGGVAVYDYNNDTVVNIDALELFSNSLNVQQIIEDYDGMLFLGYQLELDLRSEDNSIYVDFNYDDVEGVNYINLESNIDIRSDDNSVNITKETDSETNQPYFNLQVENHPQALGLVTYGLKVQAFSINYANYLAYKDQYVPLCEIYAHNIGKSCVTFEFIGREDSYGFMARYYFSSRCWDTSDLTKDYSFTGCCVQTSENAEQYFDKDNIVLVDAGKHYNTQTSKNERKYIIYFKIKSERWSDVANPLTTHTSGSYVPTFFLINVLYEDTNTYANIKWFFTGSNPISENVVNLQPGSISQTTFTSITDNTTKNIADYAIPATFTNS